MNGVVEVNKETIYSVGFRRKQVPYVVSECCEVSVGSVKRDGYSIIVDPDAPLGHDHLTRAVLHDVLCSLSGSFHYCLVDIGPVLEESYCHDVVADL